MLQRHFPQACRTRALGSSIALCATLFSVSTGAQVETARPRVQAVFTHDAEAFTQGLLLFEGKFYESTGLNGRSSLRRVMPATGVVEQRINLDATLFGEGLARVDRRLIQLTWKNGVAIVYALDSFRELTRLSYQGEGWGLCFDGTELVMSNGSDRLFFRDPESFALRGEVSVRLGGSTIANLNELECVGSLVYANVWQTNTILRIDKATGDVLTRIDASGLLTPDEARAADVLNGIAYDPATSHFYLTGKLWPKLFEVSFDFDPDGPSDAGTSTDAGNDGSTSDAGNDARAPDGAFADSATSPDAPAGTGGTGTPFRDAGAFKDAPANASDTPRTSSGGGCGCRASSGTPRAPWLMALVLLGALIRRDRARRSRQACVILTPLR